MAESTISENYYYICGVDKFCEGTRVPSFNKDMIDIEKVRQFVEERLGTGNIFLVDVKSSPANEIEVTIDSDRGVTVEMCAELNRAIEERFDSDEEDFAITVSSAGIGQPLRLLRQYRKLVGRSVEVVLLSGLKITATLKEATEDSITLQYTRKEAVEGRKRKTEVEVVQKYMLSEVKSTKEYLDYK